MRTNEFEYFTYETDETDGLGITDVYGWTRYRSGSLAGQPRKMFMANFASIEEARKIYPDMCHEHPAFEAH